MSEAVNPHAAPKLAATHIDSHDPEVQAVKLFSPKGRIGRLRYLAYTMAGYVLILLAVIVVNAVLGAWGNASAANLAVIGGVIAYLIFIALLTIQRSHDMGWSGWTTILAFIPLVGLAWLVIPGSAGSNRFGAPTPPNTLLVKIGGLLIPAIAAIGIIAAIALPAYQDYVKRAKAAQVVKP